MSAPLPILLARLANQQFVKLCECGCGEPTLVSRKNDSGRGARKGQPTRFAIGHRAGSKIRYEITPDLWQLDNGGCWIWRMALNSKGYGIVSVRAASSTLAYRVMWEQTNGPVPEGLHLDHLCRQPACINPDHLEPVAPATNTRRGLAAKITTEQAREIRESCAPIGDLMERYGLSRANIYKIRAGLLWREGGAA